MKSSQSGRVGSGFFPTVTLAAEVLLLLASSAAMQADTDSRTPEVPAAIQVPGGTNKVHFHAYAEGVQIYVWNGSSWVFQAPEAVLFADVGAQGEIGIHYVGPTWESESGSKVVGARVAGVTVDATAIPWLLLKSTSTQGPGIFDRTTYIQRVNTVGGLAPAAPGTIAGQEARVPYTAEYYFYREQ